MGPSYVPCVGVISRLEHADDGLDSVVNNVVVLAQWVGTHNPDFLPVRISDSCMVLASRATFKSQRPMAGYRGDVNVRFNVDHEPQFSGRCTTAFCSAEAEFPFGTSHPKGGLFPREECGWSMQVVQEYITRSHNRFWLQSNPYGKRKNE